MTIEYDLEYDITQLYGIWWEMLSTGDCITTYIIIVCS